MKDKRRFIIFVSIGVILFFVLLLILSLFPGIYKQKFYVKALTGNEEHVEDYEFNLERDKVYFITDDNKTRNLYVLDLKTYKRDLITLLGSSKYEANTIFGYYKQIVSTTSNEIYVASDHFTILLIKGDKVVDDIKRIAYRNEFNNKPKKMSDEEMKSLIRVSCQTEAERSRGITFIEQRYPADLGWRDPEEVFYVFEMPDGSRTYEYSNYCTNDLFKDNTVISKMKNVSVFNEFYYSKQKDFQERLRDYRRYLFCTDPSFGDEYYLDTKRDFRLSESFPVVGGGLDIGNFCPNGTVLEIMHNGKYLEMQEREIFHYSMSGFYTDYRNHVVIENNRKLFELY